MNSSNTPHFFQMILNDTDFQKIRIPKKFARKYGSGLSSPVSVKVPTGASWEVELKMCDDGMWLLNGWLEFAKHYSLSCGSFLIFRYEGNCNFHVIIFDKSATEISYPYSGSSGKGFHDHAMENNNDDVSVEILNDISPNRVRSPSPNISIRHSLIKSNVVKHEIPEPVSNADSAKRRGKRLHQATLRDEERTKALQKANSFKSENPFFSVVMQPTYVYDSCLLNLPVKFCARYLPNRGGDVILNVPQRKARSVGLSVSTRPTLIGGWKDFVRENHLEVGDVCVFEMINQTAITFNVEIFRAKSGLIPEKDDRGGKSSTSSRLLNQTPIPDVLPSKQALTKTKTADAAQGFPLFQSENPFFMITTKPSCTELLCVPYLFIREHIKQDAVKLTVDNNGEMWRVKVLIYPENKIAQFGAGWRAFARENSVNPGYVCAFEVINKEDAVLRVHLFQKSTE